MTDLAIPAELSQALAPLAAMVGGMPALAALPWATIVAIVAHTDDVLPVSPADPQVGLTGIDVDQGYSLYDSHYDPLQAVLADEDGNPATTDISSSTVPCTATFGQLAAEIAWVQEAAAGDYIYLSYTDGVGNPRVLMLVRFP